METSPLLEMWLVNTFSQPVVCLFILITGSFIERKFKILIQIQMINFYLYGSYFLCQISLPSPRFLQFHVLHLSLEQFWVKFLIQCEVWVEVYFFAYACPNAPISIGEKAVFPPLNCLCTFVKNYLGIFVWVCLWALY